MPIETASLVLENGYTNHTYAVFNSIELASKFQEEFDAFQSANNRYLRIFSSVDILKEIRKIEILQEYVRLGIIISCGIILSLILGAVAWLEFTQETYLIALLKSFGTPPSILLLHSCCENVLLVGGGTLLSFSLWKPIYTAIQNKVTQIPLQPVQSIQIQADDSLIIYAAGLTGVLLAMIPVAIGLRKPAGLILQ